VRGLYALKPWYTVRLSRIVRAAERAQLSPDVFTAVGVRGGGRGLNSARGRPSSTSASKTGVLAPVSGDVAGTEPAASPQLARQVRPEAPALPLPW
jgi:hypothetical protein